MINHTFVRQPHERVVFRQQNPHIVMVFLTNGVKTGLYPFRFRTDADMQSWINHAMLECALRGFTEV